MKSWMPILGKALFSIGAVKGVEIGDGFAAAKSTGHKNNDEYTLSADGDVIKLTNHSGRRIVGGISDGSDLIIRAAIKPTPSIGFPQDTADQSMDIPPLVSVKGRHDPVIVPRAVVVVESMVALTLVDMLFAGVTSKMENLIRFYQ